MNNLVSKASLSSVALILCVFYSSFLWASDQYQSIEWNALQAKNWQPPIIQPDPSADHAAHHVDSRSLVHSLNNKNIKIPGYLIPVKYKQNIVSEFILVPFLEQHVQVHMHHEANQMIYVSLKKGLPVTNRYTPIWVEGTLTLKVTETDEGVAGYLLSDASTSKYVY